MLTVHEVAIVGSGPAGLSAGARAAQRNISHVVLEKSDHLADTISRYQRGKHVMATPTQLTLRSDLPFLAAQREQVLAGWAKGAERLEINVRLNSEVRSITKGGDGFVLLLNDGEEIRARTVILAIGTQGNPNRLQIPGGDHPSICYQLDDPKDHLEEQVIVVGGGDAGIENALGLASRALGNTVTLLQRGPDFSRAKPANVALLEEARRDGLLDYIMEAAPVRLEAGVMVVETKEGQLRLPCDLAIARLGSAAPRRFVEACGVAFSSPDATAFPTLTPWFESTTPGLYVVGALAGYPLIKHCLNQGFDAVEHLSGNLALKPADEPILAAKLKDLAGEDAAAKLEHLRLRVPIFQMVSPLQMREFMLTAEVRRFDRNKLIVTRNEPGSSLFAVLDGAAQVDVGSETPNWIDLGVGEIFGELGLISGRRRAASVRAASCGVIVLEIPRPAILKLMATVPAVKSTIDATTTERLVKTIFGDDIPPNHLRNILDQAKFRSFKAGEFLIEEGEVGYDIFLIRSGSVVIERTIGGRKVFMSYVPAGRYVGEMSLFVDGRRNASVRASIATDATVLPGEPFRALLEAEPKIQDRVLQQTKIRLQVDDFVEAEKASFSSVVDLHTSVADFLFREGLGEATDALIIDESLCIGCDNCEVACAETHQGISRLDREAGPTYAQIHVPTSCRHCENPHCMTECPPNAISRGADGEVFINDTCIGCGACQRNCPYGVIQMAKPPPKKPGLLPWLFVGAGPGPGEPPTSWVEQKTSKNSKSPATAKVAVKCDMCKGISGGPSCVRACPTGAAMRVSPENYLRVVSSRGRRSS